MIVFLLCVSMLSALIGSTARKFYTNKLGGDFSVVALFTTITCLVSSIVLLVWGAFDGGFNCSLFTLLLGVLFGLITATQTYSNLKALKCGPMSYTYIFQAFSTIIPALSGALFFSETLTFSHIIGIVLMLGSFILATEQDKENKKATGIWLTFCAVLFITTGAIGVMQKAHQSSSYKTELNAFLIVAFITSSLVSLVLSLFSKNHLKQNLKGQKFCFILLITVVSGVCIAVNNKLNLFLSGTLDSALFFPLVNGGGLVLTTITATVMFKENLSLKRLIGVLVGLVSVVFLCNPF